MISLDQILVLEQKVESAVKKISQLQAENDALRSKCAELTNALSSKSEQLSSFEQDQGLIESKIASLISRFANIENTVMDAISQNTNVPVQESVQTPVQPQVQVQQPVTQVTSQVIPETNTSALQNQQSVHVEQPQVQNVNQVVEEPVEEETSQPSFFDMNEINSAAPDSQNNDPQFDIF
jgi:FtsZ-binding cell division protein ZapB